MLDQTYNRHSTRFIPIKLHFYIIIGGRIVGALESMHTDKSRESENSCNIVRLRTVCAATMLKGRASNDTTLKLVRCTSICVKVSIHSVHKANCAQMLKL